MTEDQPDDEEQFGASYDDLIDRLIDKKWGEKHVDACCTECGCLIDGDPRQRWTGEDADGASIFEPICKECDA